MSFTSGSRILRYKWTALPLTTDVISRVHELAFSSKSSKSPLPTLDFMWPDGSSVSFPSIPPEETVQNKIPIGPTLNDVQGPRNASGSNSLENDNEHTNPVGPTLDGGEGSNNKSENTSSVVSNHDSFSQDEIETDILNNINNANVEIQQINQLEENFNNDLNKIAHNIVHLDDISFDEINITRCIKK